MNARTRKRCRLLVLAVWGCGGSKPTVPSGDASTTADGDTSSTAGSSSSSAATTNANSGADTIAETSASSTGTTEDASTSTGTRACDKRVVVMGYWPPTNEMLRPWSPNLAQNPDGWIGEDWGAHGYDVYSFFPEFPPDGDPTNDRIGQDGSVGSPDFDLRVDYQATSADFWRIVDEYQPAILLTTSRGGEIGWEIEAIDGGHGAKNGGDPSLDWASDAHDVDFFPTQTTIEPRSWTAISTYRQGATLPTQLPVQAIVDATSVLAVTNVVVDQDTSGNYLSGFLGLHGLYYQHETPHAVAAGHIHVGADLPVADASLLIETTLDAILEAHPADRIECP